MIGDRERLVAAGDAICDALEAEGLSITASRLIVRPLIKALTEWRSLAHPDCGTNDCCGKCDEPSTEPFSDEMLAAMRAFDED